MTETKENSKVTIKEFAENYEGKHTKNISDLDYVPIDLTVVEEQGKTKEGKDFTYLKTVVDGEDYRIPYSVMKKLRDLLEAYEKKGKSFDSFGVIKSGEGLNTEYQVVPHATVEEQVKR